MPHTVAILLFSRQGHNEAVDIFYSRNSFIIRVDHDLIWSQGIGPDRRSQIHNVRLLFSLDNLGLKYETERVGGIQGNGTTQEVCLTEHFTKCYEMFKLLSQCQNLSTLTIRTNTQYLSLLSSNGVLRNYHDVAKEKITVVELPGLCEYHERLANGYQEPELIYREHKRLIRSATCDFTGETTMGHQDHKFGRALGNDLTVVFHVTRCCMYMV